MPLDVLNPWYYRAALAPRLAARRQGLQPSLKSALRHIRSVARDHACVVVEGAGGLLSPLAFDGDARELIEALEAVPFVVCPNRLGAINQTRLVLHALPAAAARVARIVLMRQARPDGSAASNLEFLKECFGPGQVVELPRLTVDEIEGATPLRLGVRRALDRLVPRED